MNADGTIVEVDIGALAQNVMQDANHRFVSDTEKAAWNGAYEQATGYTDQKIAALINGAPSTLDTLKEIADAMAENEEVVDALEAAMGTKANQSELDTHTGNNTVHITATERQSWNSKQTTTGNTANNTVTFTSGDATNPTAWTDVALLTSGEKHSSLFAKISTMFKNVRYLYKLLGTGSIPAALGTDIIAALNKLNTNLNGKAPASHTHAWGAITGKPSTFTPSSHTHDDRYYTESEVNTRINNVKIKRKTVTKSINGDYVTFSRAETGIPEAAYILDINIMRSETYGYHFVIGHGTDSGGTTFAYLDGAVSANVQFHIHYAII